MYLNVAWYLIGNSFGYGILDFGIRMLGIDSSQVLHPKILHNMSDLTVPFDRKILASNTNRLAGCRKYDREILILPRSCIRSGLAFPNL